MVFSAGKLPLLYGHIAPQNMQKNLVQHFQKFMIFLKIHRYNV